MIEVRECVELVTCTNQHPLRNQSSSPACLQPWRSVFLLTDQTVHSQRLGHRPVPTCLSSSNRPLSCLCPFIISSFLGVTPLKCVHSQSQDTVTVINQFFFLDCVGMKSWCILQYSTLVMSAGEGFTVLLTSDATSCSSFSWTLSNYKQEKLIQHNIINAMEFVEQIYREWRCRVFVRLHSRGVRIGCWRRECIQATLSYRVDLWWLTVIIITVCRQPPPPETPPVNAQLDSHDIFYFLHQWVSLQSESIWSPQSMHELFCMFH